MIFALVFYRWFIRRKLPPGPFSIPLLGNVWLPFTLLEKKVIVALMCTMQ